jgi:gluconate 5-dehydrogenase
MPDELRTNLLDPAIMGPPIVWLASPDAAGVHDERIVARDFDDWLQAHEAGITGG